MIVVVDYGAGNLRSVANAFEALGHSPHITCDPDDLECAAAIVLPGVGAFRDGMANLEEHGLIQAIHEQVMVRKVPYLGICLGLQFMAEYSTEGGVHPGLGWVRGAICRLSPSERSFRVPHMGWNDAVVKEESLLFRGLEKSSCFYFVHSYHLMPHEDDRDVVVSTCWHGETVTAAVERDNLFAVQFHPEKSQAAGLKVLENFIKLV